MKELSQSDRYEAWLNALDDICWDELGLSFEDLPDQPYRRWFDDCLTPEDAYYQLCENSYPGVDFPDVYYQQFDEFSDADPGL